VKTKKCHGPQTPTRYSKYLDSYDFFSNNIEFRVHSSRALEKWKNVQAFQLNQLVNGRFKFNPTRREVLLLKYDLWSRWLYEIENLCVELSGDHQEKSTTESDIGYIIKLAEKTATAYEDIMLRQHPERFDPEFIEIWLEQHDHIFQYMINTIKTFVGLSFDRLFTDIVDVLVDVMQYTLIEIHELDCILNTSPGNPQVFDYTPFIVITSLTERAMSEFNVCLMCERLQIYRKYFNFTEIYLKNYTDEVISSRVIYKIEKLGFTINFKKSLTR
jgi:hypothetical protein